MLLDKKDIKKNKTIKKIQSASKKANRDRTIDRNSVLKRNIEKMVSLSSDTVIGNFNAEPGKALSVSNSDELISLIESSGLTGKSGNGFETAVKLKSFLACDKNESKRTMIINAVECEPGLLHDAWLINHHMKEIQDVCVVFKNILPVDKIYLAVRGKAECQAITKPDVVNLARVPLKYPMGEEHVLINQLLNINLDKNIMPTDKGILVMNVQTIYQIWRILNSCYDGGQFVTIANLRNGEARVAYVNEKTNIVATLNIAFGKSDNSYYAGHGAFSEERVDNSATFSNLVAFACIADESKVSNNNPCKKCGGCSKKCPMGVSVKDIVLAKEQNPQADISKFGSDKCINCGTCAYFCPAQKNPMLYILSM